MSNDAFKTWHLPLSDKQRAENLERIRERHQQMLAMGPELWAAQGRNARFKVHSKPSFDTEAD